MDKSIQINKLQFIPNNPGCYLYKDKRGKIIYVGKGKNLKKRVSSYFQKNDHNPKTRNLVRKIEFIDFIVTNNEVEALILENTLIKKHKPQYNINLKDSGNYAYIELTNEAFSRLRVAVKKQGKGKYFGPFVSAQERDRIIAILKKTFRLRTCKRMPKKICLRYRIDLCNAPCVNYISKDEYDSDIRDVKLVLNGNTTKLIERMEKKMLSCSHELNFEKALSLRDQIKALRFLNEHQTVERKRLYDEDIINFIVKSGKVYLILFNVYKGTLSNKNEYSFDFNEDFFEEFIVQYYSEHDVPSELILPCKIAFSLVSFLFVKKNKKVTITVPQRGDKKLLLDLVEKNIEKFFFKEMLVLEEVTKVLKLSKNAY